MFIIYTKETNAKKVFDINLNKVDLDEICQGNYFIDHPELKPEDHIVVERDYPFEYPTYDVDKNEIREMTLMERYENGLYALSEHEIIHKNEIVQLEPGQYLDSSSESIVTVPQPEELLKPQWNWETNTWEETATDLDIVNAQYQEYEGLDTPSFIQQMNQTEVGLGDELVNMLIELRNMSETLSADTQPVQTYSLKKSRMNIKTRIPKPSKTLIEFNKKYNKNK